VARSVRGALRGVSSNSLSTVVFKARQSLFLSGG
jgi:hypothetical protein